MKEFKLRASAAGTLMTNGRGKDAVMGETAKSYVKEWVISQLTGKTKEISSKYLTRGIEVEPLAIERIARYYNQPLAKNETQLEDEYFTGTYDTMIKSVMVIDAKAPWDCFTMPYFVNQVDKDYHLQLQVYMELTGLKKAALCYCLENGTAEEIEKLSWKIAKKAGREEPDIEDWEAADRQLNYDHLPESMRIKVWEFDYDADIIADLQQRVLDARVYIKNELLPIL